MPGGHPNAKKPHGMSLYLSRGRYRAHLALDLADQGGAGGDHWSGPRAAQRSESTSLSFHIHGTHPLALWVALSTRMGPPWRPQNQKCVSDALAAGVQAGGPARLRCDTRANSSVYSLVEQYHASHVYTTISQQLSMLKVFPKRETQILN